MAETLTQRGRIVLQTVNFDRVLDERRAAFPVIERVLPDGGRVAFFREYDWEALPGRLLFKTRLVTPVGEHRAAWPLLPLRREEVVRCVGDAGLSGHPGPRRLRPQPVLGGLPGADRRRGAALPPR